MKKYCKHYCFLLCVFLVTSCSDGQQIKSSVPNNTFEISLEEYKVSDCLNDILQSIVEADSAHLRFPPSLYYYQLQFSNLVSYRTMIITPARWQRHLPKDCVGAVRQGGMSFLCMGNFSQDSLFHKKGKSIDIVLQIISSPEHDSLDRKVNWYDWKRSPTAIVGKFGLCEGPPVDLYINVGKRLEGVERP